MRTLFSLILILALWIGMPSITGDTQGTTSSTITAIAWHPTNNWIATGHQDGTVHIINIDDQSILETYHELAGLSITDVQWDRSGVILAASHWGLDSTIMIWPSGIEESTSIYTDALITSIAFDPSSQYIYGVSAGLNTSNTMHKWNLAGDVIVEVSAGAYTDFAVSHNGVFLALGSFGDLTIRANTDQFDIIGMATTGSYEITEDTWTVKWNATDTQILTGQADGNVTLWDFNSSILALETTFQANDSPFGWNESVVRDVAFTAGDTQIAAISADGTIRVWDITGGLLADVQLGNSISAAAFNPSGDTLAYSSPNDDTIITMETPSTTITCDTTIVSGDVTGLISAIDSADNTPEADTICLEAGTYTLTAVDNSSNGDNGLPQITTDITLVGLDAGATLYRDGTAAAFRHLLVGGTGHLSLENLTLENGDAGSFKGGAIRVDSGGQLTTDNVTFLNNTAGDDGGAIFTFQGTITATKTPSILSFGILRSRNWK